MQRIRWKLTGVRSQKLQVRILTSVFCLLSPYLWAQGTVSATVSQLGQTSVWVIQYNWTGDTGGNVPVTAAGNLPAVQGYEITQIECVPGTPQPSATYSVAVLDAGSVDVLAGAANAVSGGQAQTFNAASSTPPLQGTLRLQVTNNTINGAKGVVYVFLQKPGTLSAKKIRGMGSGGGGAFTADWLTLANAPFMDARRYRFAPQAPGGTLIAGSNTINLQPCPIGVNGSDTNHYLYISGGTGAAESVLITGGGCVSGNASSTVTFTAANSHSGAWTVQSASGGLQEAICALPAAGGIVGAPVAVTLNANVGACGKTNPAVNKPAGIVISGAFTVLGVPPGGPNAEEYGVSPNWTSNGVYDAFRYAVGGYPLSGEFGFGVVPAVQGLVSAIEVPTTASGSSSGHSAAIAGYARSTKAGFAPVGVFGQGNQGVANSQAWGANFSVSNVQDSNSYSLPIGSPRFAGGDLWGIEIDAGSYAPSGATFIRGLEIVGGSDQAPAQWGRAISIRALGVSATPKIPWTYAIYVERTAAQTGILLDATSDSNPANSQSINLTGRDATGNAKTGILFVDPNGNWFMRTGAAATYLYLTDNTGASMAAIGSNALSVQNLPSVAPAAGSKSFYYDPADGNRVKYVP